MGTTAVPDRFSALPRENDLQATVLALEEHGFSVEVAGDLDAARQGRFWDMHELLFHRQRALEDGDLRGYAAQLGLDVAALDRDRASTATATTRPPCWPLWRRRPHPGS